MNCTPALWIPLGIFLLTLASWAVLVRAFARESNTIEPSFERIAGPLNILVVLQTVLLVGALFGGILIAFPLPR